MNPHDSDGTQPGVFWFSRERRHPQTAKHRVRRFTGEDLEKVQLAVQ